MGVGVGVGVNPILMIEPNRSPVMYTPSRPAIVLGLPTLMNSTAVVASTCFAVKVRLPNVNVSVGVSSNSLCGPAESMIVPVVLSNKSLGTSLVRSGESGLSLEDVATRNSGSKLMTTCTAETFCPFGSTTIVSTKLSPGATSRYSGIMRRSTTGSKPSSGIMVGVGLKITTAVGVAVSVGVGVGVIVGVAVGLGVRVRVGVGVIVGVGRPIPGAVGVGVKVSVGVGDGDGFAIDPPPGESGLLVGVA